MCTYNMSSINEFFTISFLRVPTSTGKHGKSHKKVPCMEKSWNLKKTEKSWHFVK